MKNTIKISVLLLAMLLLGIYGCNEDYTDTNYDPDKLPSEFSAVTGTTESMGSQTRASLNSALKVIWSEDDQIGIFAGDYLNQQYSVKKLIAESAVFNGELIKGNIEKLFAYFPYDPSVTQTNDVLNINLPSVQHYLEDSFDKKSFPMVAVASSQSLLFKNLCGVVKFNVKDKSVKTIKNIKLHVSNENTIAGKAQIDMNYGTGLPELNMLGDDIHELILDCGEFGVNMDMVSSKGVDFYFVLPPQKYKDAMLILENTDGEVYYQNIEGELTIERSKIVSLPSFVPYSEEIFYGKSNSILKDAPGTYTFDATPYFTIDSEFYAYQFNTLPNLTVASSVKLLWQDSQNMISAVSLSDDGKTVEFTAASKGNALVAIYDINDNILWSFHLWITDHNIVEYPNGYKVLDRNLGALSNVKGNIESWGLYYQWGRKDPFASSSSIVSNNPVQTQYFDIDNNPFTFPTAQKTGLGIDQYYTTSNPTTYIDASSATSGDWYFESNNGLWGNPLGYNKPDISTISKSVYDPCPEGFMVPPADIFINNGVVNGSSENMALDVTNRGRTLSFQGLDEWYPAARHLKVDGTRNVNGDIGRYWMSNPFALNNIQGMSMSYGAGNNVFPQHNQNRAFGFSVRCVKTVKGE